MKWVLFKKNSISENSDSISETGFNSVRVLMTKVRYILKTLADQFDEINSVIQNDLTAL